LKAASFDACAEASRQARIRSSKQQSGAAILRNRFEIAHLALTGGFTRNIDYDQ
jgi:hypothetical protein